MKTKTLLTLFAVICAASITAQTSNYTAADAAIGGPLGTIVDSSALAKGVRLWVRFDDGDNPTLTEESVNTATAVLTYLQGFGKCAYLTERLSKGSVPFLLPKGSSSILLARVVDKYIADHPEEMSLPPGDIVWNALVHAFPNEDFKDPNK